MRTLTFMKTQNCSKRFHLFQSSHEKTSHCKFKYKTLFSCVITAQLISGFDFFVWIVSTNSLLHKSLSSSLKPFSVTVQPRLRWTWSETSNTGFLTTQLIFNIVLCHSIIIVYFSYKLRKTISKQTSSCLYHRTKFVYVCLAAMKLQKHYT